jgi:hypothetical protein
MLTGGWRILVSIEMIVVSAFFAVMLVLALLYRKSTLKHLAMMPDETILFEETGVTVDQAGSPRSVRFPKCTVRVTSHRIIIAQKTLFGNTMVLRHVITYDRYAKNTDLRATLSKGYLVMQITPSQVSCAEGAEGTIVTIEIPDSALTKGQYITYYTQYPEQYREIFSI